MNGSPVALSRWIVPCTVRKRKHSTGYSLDLFLPTPLAHANRVSSSLGVPVMSFQNCVEVNDVSGTPNCICIYDIERVYFSNCETVICMKSGDKVRTDEPYRDFINRTKSIDNDYHAKITAELRPPEDTDNHDPADDWKDS